MAKAYHQSQRKAVALIDSGADANGTADDLTPGALTTRPCLSIQRSVLHPCASAKSQALPGQDVTGPCPQGTGVEHTIPLVPRRTVTTVGAGFTSASPGSAVSNRFDSPFAAVARGSATPPHEEPYLPPGRRSPFTALARSPGASSAAMFSRLTLAGGSTPSGAAAAAAVGIPQAPPPSPVAGGGPPPPPQQARAPFNAFGRSLTPPSAVTLITMAVEGRLLEAARQSQLLGLFVFTAVDWLHALFARVVRGPDFEQLLHTLNMLPTFGTWPSPLALLAALGTGISAHTPLHGAALLIRLMARILRHPGVQDCLARRPVRAEALAALAAEEEAEAAERGGAAPLKAGSTARWSGTWRMELKPRSRGCLLPGSTSKAKTEQR